MVYMCWFFFLFALCCWMQKQISSSLISINLRLNKLFLDRERWFCWQFSWLWRKILFVLLDRQHGLTGFQNFLINMKSIFDLVLKCLYVFPCTSEVCINLSCFLKIAVKHVELQSFMYTLTPWFGLWRLILTLDAKS